MRLKYYRAAAATGAQQLNFSNMNCCVYINGNKIQAINVTSKQDYQDIYERDTVRLIVDP